MPRTIGRRRVTFSYEARPDVAKKRSARKGGCIHEARPKRGDKDNQVQDYVVEDHADHVMATFPTQNDAIVWAIKNGHTPHVARVRHLNDKTKPDHWRAV
jgi:hypothetical protein